MPSRGATDGAEEGGWERVREGQFKSSAAFLEKSPAKKWRGTAQASKLTPNSPALPHQQTSRAAKSASLKMFRSFLFLFYPVFSNESRSCLFLGGGLFCVFCLELAPVPEKRGEKNPATAPPSRSRFSEEVGHEE